MEEETVIKVETTEDEAEKKSQEAEESQEITLQKVVEEEVSMEVIPQQGIQDEGIAFSLFLYIHEMVK